MDYAVQNEPTMKSVPAPQRERVVRSAMDRLEKLAAESDEIVERLQATFSPVLFHGPEECQATHECDAILGSDLGQALMRLAGRIDSNFRAIRGVIESADV